MNSRAIAALLLSTAAIGCSPYEYGKEIDRFEDGVTALSASFVDGATGFQADRTYLLRWYVLTNPDAKLATSFGCAPTPGATGNCELEILDENNEPDDSIVPVDQEGDQESLSKITAYMAVLQRYAAALQEITDADDSAKLTAAQGRFEQGLGPITAAASLPGAGVQAAVKLFNTGVKLTLEQRRYQTLKSVVIEMDSEIQVVAQKLIGDGNSAGTQSIVNWYYTKQIETQAAAVKRIQVALEQAKKPELATLRPAWFDALSEATVRFERLRRTDPDAVVTTMAKAHASLKTAFERNEDQAGIVFENVEIFAKQAIALRDALSN